MAPFAPNLLELDLPTTFQNSINDFVKKLVDFQKEEPAAKLEALRINS